jgi:hypothetical protein
MKNELSTNIDNCAMIILKSTFYIDMPSYDLMCTVTS